MGEVNVFFKLSKVNFLGKLKFLDSKIQLQTGISFVLLNQKINSWMF